MAARKTATSVRRAPKTVSVQRAISDAMALRKAEAAQRAQARTILSPTEVSGDYDAGRALKTTFGDAGLRDLTPADLEAFRKNIATIGKRYKGGITAKEVISRSLPIDRRRAMKQIRQAVPQRAKKGRIHFVTNAGPDSDKSRHFVDVDLLLFPSAVASPNGVMGQAKKISEGRLKFDCDCGRHRYWYRYISTIGGFNANRPEPGFPKIRNPNLRGLACKHVLRVMQQLTTAGIVRVIAKMIEAERAAIETGRAKVVTLTSKEAADIAAKQLREAGLKRNQIVPAAKRKTVANVKKTIQAKVAARKVASPDRVSKSAIDAIKQITRAAELGALSQKEFIRLVTILSKRK